MTGTIISETYYVPEYPILPDNAGMIKDDSPLIV
jgi:hypothetical protein